MNAKKVQQYCYYCTQHTMNINTMWSNQIHFQNLSSRINSVFKNPSKWTPSNSMSMYYSYLTPASITRWRFWGVRIVRKGRTLHF